MFRVGVLEKTIVEATLDVFDEWVVRAILARA
jgi:hypothetical protein